MSKRLMVTVDSHTQGEPTRLVVGGFIHYPGSSMREKQTFLSTEHDEVRKALMGEPRGHYDMFGGFVTPPVTPDGDLGVVWMDNQGYLSMCGHGTIGLCTTVVEVGMVQASSARTTIRIDTVAGRVTGFALTDNGQVIGAGFQNVPSFCLSVGERIDVDGFGSLDVGIAYGGNFFAIVAADAVGVKIDLANMKDLRQAGREIKAAVNQQLAIQHPLVDEISGVDIVTFYGPPENAEATYKNVHVFANGQVDRSPGGTGTSAHLAYLIAKGEIGRDESVTVEGLAGGLFEGRVVRTWEEDGITWHVPEIAGQAYVTGIHHFLLDTRDPLGYVPTG